MGKQCAGCDDDDDDDGDEDDEENGDGGYDDAPSYRQTVLASGTL